MSNGNKPASELSNGQAVNGTTPIPSVMPPEIRQLHDLAHSRRISKPTTPRHHQIPLMLPSRKRQPRMMAVENKHRPRWSWQRKTSVSRNSAISVI